MTADREMSANEAKNTWLDRQPPDSVWRPTDEEIQASHVARLMTQAGVSTYQELHAWSVANRAEYWKLAVEAIGVRFRQPCQQWLDLSGGSEHAQWMVGAEWNIAESCFRSPDAAAIIEAGEGRSLQMMTAGELNALSSRIAHSLAATGIRPGDSVALILPMNSTAVACLLGVIKCGAVAVGIAESFSKMEIAVRLRLGNVRRVLIQDVLVRGGKSHRLYDRLCAIESPPAVVIPHDGRQTTEMRDGDLPWEQFLADDLPFAPLPRTAEQAVGILFSSGTTGEPKAIPWSNLCPIKCAVDAHFHHDTRPGDVLAWPTSLGWMMGPWLIFASLLNRSAMALYNGLPTDQGFAEFVEQARVTMLGVVPSLVAAWRSNLSWDRVDWSGIRLFSSTGECPNRDDMVWLMKRAGGRPVIEYCGGTEIAGGYLTGTLLRPCVAATFNTPALGMDVVLLDESGEPARQGEMFLAPPAIGLSTELLHRDHHEVYFADCPQGPSGEVLRRHGDEMEALPDGYFQAHGRVDDTMNLGGIKVSSAEIEQAIAVVDGVCELAAVAETPQGGGPSELVVYAVVEEVVDLQQLQRAMQAAVRERLNPLFKVARVELIDKLPRTASNKVLRRQLRERSRPDNG